MNANEYLVSKKALEQFIKEEKMFSSVCITNEIKKNGTWIRNRDIAEFLRESVLPTSFIMAVPYCATLIIVQTKQGPTNAYVYHPLGTIPDSFFSRDQKAIDPEEFERLHGINPITGEKIKKETGKGTAPKKTGTVKFNFPDNI